MDTIYGAAEFKAHCLQIIEKVVLTGQDVHVTKRGHPMVRIVPEYVEEPKTAYGFLAGSVTVKDDLLSTNEVWDADHE
ncbi:type II toxin-antitoxin system Phd/YefM family antitoxin [Gracilinema caldarium]|uniref:Prevent-host-death family protein n=2 Tax=Gracilinema caldarium TaxID=215591 RepID=F8EYF1_GRAC1|nr:type II toxin-antitoxin system prevent-host-death family antitoxin [Gracilinema caldarium]AEJ18383.1 prevent-host-death family protein [Gracilinema caldarium DSM 7334]